MVNGYLEIERQRGARGVITGSAWTLTDPAAQKSRSQQQFDYPQMGEPRVAEPHADNRTLKKKNNLKNIYLKNLRLLVVHPRVSKRTPSRATHCLSRVSRQPSCISGSSLRNARRSQTRAIALLAGLRLLRALR